LRGYINELAEAQVLAGPDLELTVSTFAHWAMDLIGDRVLDNERRERKLPELGRGLGLDDRFLFDEVDYVLGRLMPGDFNGYLGMRRDGRGQSPQMQRPMRQRLLTEVIEPYSAWKHEERPVELTDHRAFVGNLEEFDDFYCRQLDTLYKLAPSKRHEIGRNDQRPCGSGKKYKVCHGA
jgi:hypothetical protein